MIGCDEPAEELPERSHNHNEKQNADDTTILQQADNKLDDLHAQ